MNLLTKLSLIISLIGILILLFLSNTLQAKTTGKIISIKTFDDFSIIELDNNQTITCTNCKFKINQTIKVKGKITKYKNQPQIEADEINVI